MLGGGKENRLARVVHRLPRQMTWARPHVNVFKIEGTKNHQMVVIGIGVKLGGIVEVEALMRDPWGHIKVGDGGGIKGETGGSRHGGPERGTRE